MAIGGVCFGMVCGGMYAIMGPVGIINHIKAIPRSVSQDSSAVSKKVGRPELQIEVELKRAFPLPGVPARKIYVSSGEIELPFPLFAAGKRMTPKDIKEERARRVAKEAAREVAIEYEYVDLVPSHSLFHE